MKFIKDIIGEKRERVLRAEQAPFPDESAQDMKDAIQSHASGLEEPFRLDGKFLASDEAEQPEVLPVSDHGSDLPGRILAPSGTDEEASGSSLADDVDLSALRDEGFLKEPVLEEAARDDDPAAILAALAQEAEQEDEAELPDDDSIAAFFAGAREEDEAGHAGYEETEEAHSLDELAGSGEINAGFEDEAGATLEEDVASDLTGLPQAELPEEEAHAEEPPMAEPGGADYAAGSAGQETQTDYSGIAADEAAPAKEYRIFKRRPKMENAEDGSEPAPRQRPAAGRANALSGLARPAHPSSSTNPPAEEAPQPEMPRLASGSLSPFAPQTDPVEPAEMPAPAQPQVQPSAPVDVPAPAIGRGASRAGRVKTRLLGFTPGQAAGSDPFASGGAAASGSAYTQHPVGWLVVVGGPGRGAAFTLYSGVTVIGRGEDQSVRLDFGDNSISRDNHAAIAYDAEMKGFYIGHGGKANLVRRNGRPVLATEELENGDLIRIGETTLRFVPLCGPDFSWEEDGAAHAAVR